MKTVYTPDGNEVRLNAVDAKDWVNAKLATYEPPTVKAEPVAESVELPIHRNTKRNKN